MYKYWYETTRMDLVNMFDEKTRSSLRPVGQGEIVNVLSGKTLCEIAGGEKVELKGRLAKRSEPVPGLPICPACVAEYKKNGIDEVAMKWRAWTGGMNG